MLTISMSAVRTLTCSLLLISTQSALAEKPLTKNEYQSLFMASFTYMNVIKACNNTSLFNTADSTVNKVIAYGYKFNLHDSNTQRISQNVSLYTSEGIESFRKSAKVSCSDGEKYMRQIAAAVNKLN